MAEVQLTPILFLFLFLFLFAVFLIGTERKLFSNSGGARLPPGPSKLPVIGNLHQLRGGLPHRVLCDLAGVHGPLMLLRLGQVDFAVVSSRDAALQVTKSHDLNFAHRPQLLVPSIICYGCSDIVFSPYGDYWRQMRRICATELFSAKRVRSFSAIRAEEVAELLRDAAAAAAADQPMNVNHKLTALSNSIVCRASFGFKCHNQHAFIETMKEVMMLASGFCVADLFPSLKFVASISGLASKLKKLHRKVDELLDAAIKEHQSSKSEGDEEDLLDVLLRLKDDGSLETPITFDNIKAVILDVFTGGTETSSTVVEWTMSELIRNPTVMAKAQAEVRETMMRRTSRDFDEEVIGELHYLKLVIKESLRLRPPVPLLLPRVAKEACQVLDYEVPAGTRVLINAWALGRDPLYWGGDAERFRPERFEGGEVDYKGSHLEFVPFGAGRRICPGMAFGMATVELVLAQLLFHFDWKVPGGGEVNTEAEELDMEKAFGASVVRKEELRLVPVLRYPPPPAARRPPPAA
ncbi:premnaspirodiene oxygenase-like [Curcuma longa]|uniref:premnaspirodiene oxygenase-like n=1 Tax=Curcuma longa TaxID=136217 RepID=UPI003D9E53E7